MSLSDPEVEAMVVKGVEIPEMTEGTYCTVLYCTVLHCTVLYCTVLYCIWTYARWCHLFASFHSVCAYCDMCTLYFKRLCVHFLNMRSHFVFSISYLLRLMSHSSSTLSDILSILFFLMSLTNCFTFLTIQMNGRSWLAKKKLCSHVHRQNKN